MALRQNACFLFPGQGSVVPGMGKSEYHENGAFRISFDSISELANEDIADICWGERRFKLKDDPYLAHLALFAYEYSLFKALEEAGLRPSIMMGHSLGEIIGFICAKGVDLPSGVEWVKCRGRLFRKNQATSSGEMLAVSGDPDKVEAFIVAAGGSFRVFPANFNSPRQLVVSLYKEDEYALFSLAVQCGLKPTSLKIGNGCHSPLVENIDGELRYFVEQLKFKVPENRVFSSSFLKLITEPEEAVQAFLRHLMAPVYWKNAFESVQEFGADDFMELGGSKVLKGLILSMDRTAQVDSAPVFLDRTKGYARIGGGP